MAILNLTQHNATADQLAAGIIDLPAEFKQELAEIITFPALYTKHDLELRARRVYSLILDLPCDIPVDGVMIGGMPSFMPVLEKELVECGFRVGYACTERQSVDKEVDGKIIKTAIFVHVGMYWAN